MATNEQTFHNFHDNPAEGIKYFNSILKHRLLGSLEKNLRDNIDQNLLYDDLIKFYTQTPFVEFNSLHYELTTLMIDIIYDYEKEKNCLVNKEKIYFFRALCQIISSNTVGAIANLELAKQEKSRITGQRFEIQSLLNDLPQFSMMDQIEEAYHNNPLISSLMINYRTLFTRKSKDIIVSLNGLDALSFLSNSIKSVTIQRLLSHFQNSLEVNRIFAQEIINNLCILNESLLKNYPEVSQILPRKKDQQIGRILNSVLPVINASVSNSLGMSVSPKTGLYATLDLTDSSSFNRLYPQYINTLESSVLTLTELKAYILLGLHALRNKVLHDYDDTLCYYTNSDLFLRTIGLLFAGVTITSNLK